MKAKVWVIAGLTSCVGLLAFSSNIVKQQIATPLADTNHIPKHFGFGRPASPQEIAAWDIDVRPDGKGLPAGEGNTITGRSIYTQKCVACHGSGDEPATVKLLGPALIGDTVLKSRRKTIGNYWPYTTTLFDYIRRAMPYTQPGSLTDNEVYSLTAYLLNANHVIKPELVLNAKTLPKIVMPAKKLFVFDDRKGGPEIK